MKKLFVSICSIVFLATSSFAFISIGIRGAYYSPTDSDFKSIYGGGIMLGGEFSFQISNRLNAWLDGSYFSKSGKLTFSNEKTNMSLVPIGIGLRYLLTQGKLAPYVGVGIKYCLYKEKNIIGEVSSGGLGLAAKIGVLLNVSRKIGFNVHFEYSYCKMKPADFAFNAGGVGIGADVVFTF